MNVYTHLSLEDAKNEINQLEAKRVLAILEDREVG